MASRRSEEFQREAVRLALTSGLTPTRIAAGPGAGLSMLNSERIRAAGPSVSPKGLRRIGMMA